MVEYRIILGALLTIWIMIDGNVYILIIGKIIEENHIFIVINLSLARLGIQIISLQNMKIV